MTVEEIQSKKKQGQKITMLTAYDYPLAFLLDKAGIDIILVGDSVANVVLGLDSTKEVGIEQMLHHAKAVRRGVKQALLIGDMPFEALNGTLANAILSAKRFIKEAGCDGVKVEWSKGCLKITEAILKAGIPVMGHVGLTPQTAEELGGFKVQGKDEGSAKKILENAKAFEEAGCFSLVLECIPKELAKIITKELSIPTIGIGAGVDCDGQVLVTHDLLGLFDRYKPKFVKQYINLSEEILKGILEFRKEVEQSQFPDPAHSYSMDPEELKRIGG